MQVKNPLKYQVNKANTERYKNSSIPYMQRLLKNDHQKRKRQVNYVSKTITVENKAYYYYYYYIITLNTSLAP